MITSPALTDNVLQTDTGSWLTAAAAAVARRSVRKFSGAALSETQINELLGLVGRAPSAFNVQPWRFVVVRDETLKRELQGAAYNQAQVSGAPVVIAMYSDMEDAIANAEEVVNPGLAPDKAAETAAMLRRTFGGMPPDARAAWGNAQANIALGYLLLLASARGIGTSPMLGFQPDAVKSLLGIPAHATITALIALGWGNEDGYVSHRHDIERVVTFR